MRRVLLVALVAACVAAFVWWPRAGGAPGRLAWTVGERLVYELDAATRARIAMAEDQAVQGRVAVAGRLELRVYGERDGAALVELVLAASRIELEAAGVDALGGDPAGELGETRAWLEIAGDGDVRSVAFAPGARPAWKDLAAQLVGWLEVVVDPGEAWSADQLGPFGTGAVAYARDGATLTRTRRAYATLDAVAGDLRGLAQEVDGRGTIELDGGHLVRVDEAETIAVRRGAAEVLDGEAHLRLRLVEVGRARVAAPSSLGERRRPGQRVASHDAAQLLAERAGDLTRERAISDVIAFGDVGLPDAGEWMWRATALVRLHPELADELRALAVSGRLGAGGVALVADLLAAAGTPEAQAALRGVLAGAPVDGAARVALVQRLSLVTDPTPETIAYARTLRESAADVDAARAGAYVAGNLAGTLRERGDAAAAAALVAPLVDDLAAATDPDDRAALAVAIGSAGLPEHEPVLTGLAADRDAGVRRASVLGLARQPGEGARDALIELSADADGAVRGAALRALAGRDLDDAAVDRLAARLASGVDQDAQGDLVRLLVAQDERGADLTRFAPAIDATLARGGDPTIAEALRRARQ